MLRGSEMCQAQRSGSFQESAAEVRRPHNDKTKSTEVGRSLPNSGPSQIEVHEPSLSWSASWVGKSSSYCVSSGSTSTRSRLELIICVSRDPAGPHGPLCRASLLDVRAVALAECARSAGTIDALGVSGHPTTGEFKMAKAPKKLDELFHDTLKDIYFAEKKI
jgi:hypothetical protein